MHKHRLIVYLKRLIGWRCFTPFTCLLTRFDADPTAEMYVLSGSQRNAGSSCEIPCLKRSNRML